MKEGTSSGFRPRPAQWPGYNTPYACMKEGGTPYIVITLQWEEVGRIVERGAGKEW